MYRGRVKVYCYFLERICFDISCCVRFYVFDYQIIIKGLFYVRGYREGYGIDWVWRGLWFGGKRKNN